MVVKIIIYDSNCTYLIGIIKLFVFILKQMATHVQHWFSAQTWVAIEAQWMLYVGECACIIIFSSYKCYKDTESIITMIISSLKMSMLHYASDMESIFM